MSRLYQIHEQDLADLEQLMPVICESIGRELDSAEKIRVRRIQKILSDVRWNYGPHSEVENIEDSE